MGPRRARTSAPGAAVRPLTLHAAAAATGDTPGQAGRCRALGAPPPRATHPCARFPPPGWTDPPLERRLIRPTGQKRIRPSRSPLPQPLMVEGAPAALVAARSVRVVRQWRHSPPSLSFDKSTGAAPFGHGRLNDWRGPQTKRRLQATGRRVSGQPRPHPVCWRRPTIPRRDTSCVRGGRTVATSTSPAVAVGARGRSSDSHGSGVRPTPPPVAVSQHCGRARARARPPREHLNGSWHSKDCRWKGQHEPQHVRRTIRSLHPGSYVVVPPPGHTQLHEREE